MDSIVVKDKHSVEYATGTSWGAYVAGSGDMTSSDVYQSFETVGLPRNWHPTPLNIEHKHLTQNHSIFFQPCKDGAEERKGHSEP